MTTVRATWTEDERAAVAEMRAAGKRPREIAAATGRSSQPVAACLRVLRQRAKQPAATALNTPWSDEDEFTLSLLRRMGRSFPEMAQVLRRSENTLRSKASRRGLADPEDATKAAAEPRQAWAEDDDLLLMKLVELGWDIERTAKFVRRTEGSVQTRMARIGLSTGW